MSFRAFRGILYKILHKGDFHDLQSFEDVELFDCPLCHGSGLIEEENGWCLYVQCLDCGCHTAELSYNNEEERQAAARQAASLWNVGKVIHTGVGD